MRIKISTLNPLPKLDFWHVIPDKSSNLTVLDLQRDINQQTHLSKNIKKLSLSIDGFRLLPNSTINDLVRDGDTLTVQKLDRIDQTFNDNKPTTSETTKPKKKLSSEKLTKTDSDKKSNKRKREDQSSSSKVDKTEKTHKEKKSKTSKTSEEPSTSTATVQPSKTKNEKTLEKTRKRNQRRKLLKKFKAIEKQPIINTAPENNNNKDIVASKDKENSKEKKNNGNQLTVEKKKKNKKIKDKEEENKLFDIKDQVNEYTSTSTTSTITSKKLLKKNKNKKKDFLKDMNTKPKMHVHFEEGDGYNNNNNKTNDYDGQQQYVNNNYNDEQCTEYYNQDEQYTDDYNYNELDYYTDDYINNIDIPLNTYGAAFVTNVDSEINNNKKKKNSNYVRNGYQERQYPVDEAGPIIYAVNEEDGNDHNKKESSIITATDDDDNNNDINNLEIPKKKVDYDTCPKISMQSDNGPVVGEHIAIKTLDLSDTYTPEISDWKEVKVLEVNKNEITVLLIQQVKQSNKGKRKFDLPDEDNEDQVENNESQEDNILQYMSTDIFDMCRITV